jgi:hypothetical protein
LAILQTTLSTDLSTSLLMFISGPYAAPDIPVFHGRGALEWAPEMDFSASSNGKVQG